MLANYDTWATFKIPAKHPTRAVAALAAAETSSVVWDGQTPAVSVAGYFHAEMGIGVAARPLLIALEAGRIPFNTILRRYCQPAKVIRSQIASPARPPISILLYA